MFECRSSPEVGLAVLQELAEECARLDEQFLVCVHVNDEVDRFEENGILGIRVLNFLRFRSLLRLAHHQLYALLQLLPHRRVV